VKYECLSCKKTFLHVGRLTNNDVSIGMNTAPVINSLEVSVCPYCKSLDIEDHVEVEPAITSVKSVDLAEVDGFLKEGYVVHELYAKTATIIKKEVPK